MKIKVILFIIFFLNIFLYSENSNKSRNDFILSENIVIFYEDKNINVKRWMPNENEVFIAKEIVKEFLILNNQNNIIKKYNNYKKQYAGLIINGEKVILINYLTGDFDIKKLKNQYITVKDGGDNYFNIKVNLENKKCFDFVINGDG